MYFELLFFFLGVDPKEAQNLARGSDGTVRLGNSENGWGTGCHPSTRLCLEFLSDELRGGEAVLDYGTGSGVLAIASLRLGASRVTAVDVDAEVNACGTLHLFASLSCDYLPLIRWHRLLMDSVARF